MRSSRRSTLGTVLAAVVILLVAAPPEAALSAPTKIAVFEFELDDRSAGGRARAADPIDVENLEKSTQEARRSLSESDRYSLVDTSAAAGEAVSRGGIRNCEGCEARLAESLGADLSLFGLVARVSRTEYTVQIVVRDARTGEILSNAFTGLRLGANYAWPRGVKWLMKNRVLQPEHAK